jgi:hypothetical protein
VNLWLEWSDDPIGLAGTGRRVGVSWDEARAFVARRFPGVVFEGPFPDIGAARKTYVMVREFPDDFTEKPDVIALAARVDAVREGRMTMVEYEAGLLAPFAGLLVPFAKRERREIL